MAKKIITLDDSELNVNKYAALMGAKGGKKSRRTLTKKQAQAMVVARERKRKKAFLIQCIGKMNPPGI